MGKNVDIVGIPQGDQVCGVFNNNIVILGFELPINNLKQLRHNEFPQ